MLNKKAAFDIWDDNVNIFCSLFVSMFDKKFFDSPIGLKQILAYELYVNHGLYQKQIASFLGCSNNTVANYVKKLNKYKHLKDFNLVLESKANEVEKALEYIKKRGELDEG